MKRCSTCNRTYTDPNLSFCIDDGTPLTVASEDESTVVTPRGDSNSGNNDWNAPYRPPGAYVPPGAQAGRRRAWPWILGIAGAFILGIIAISIAAAILAPRLIRSGQNHQANSNVAPGNANQAENSNIAAPANTNSNANEAAEVPPPTDRAQVLAQLTDLENEWTVANLNADKQKLDQILADDYIGPTSEEDELQSKAEYIRTIQRNTSVDKWEFRDLKLILTGDRATLTGNITYLIQGQERVFDFRDKFVWREGRWQATGSELKPRESV
jgi:Domain of unknown function (DUF4440)